MSFLLDRKEINSGNNNKGNSFVKIENANIMAEVTFFCFSIK